MSMFMNPKSENCICVGSASVSKAHVVSQTGRPRLSAVGKRENVSVVEQKS